MVVGTEDAAHHKSGAFRRTMVAPPGTATSRTGPAVSAKRAAGGTAVSEWDVAVTSSLASTHPVLLHHSNPVPSARPAPATSSVWFAWVGDDVQYTAGGLVPMLASATPVQSKAGHIQRCDEAIIHANEAWEGEKEGKGKRLLVQEDKKRSVRRLVHNAEAVRHK